MFKNKTVNIHLKCNESTFSNYSDLISKDGHKYIEKEGFRHYSICEIPRINFSTYDSEREEVHVNIQVDADNFEAKSFKIKSCAEVTDEEKGETVTTKISKIEKTKYPEIKMTLESGHCRLYANTYEFLCHVLEPGNENLFHEIVYIGQTEVTGKYLRLKQHETFGQVSNNYHNSKPHRLLAIKLLKFENPEIMVLDGQELEGKVKEVIGEFTPNQITNLIEAALINGYKPEFNEHYKYNFPSAEHERYNFIYNGVIDTVTLEVNENLRSYSLNLCGYTSNAQIFGWSLSGNSKSDFQDVFITNE